MLRIPSGSPGLVTVLLLTACGRVPPPPVAGPEAPPIGIIDFFGRQRMSEADLRAALGVAEGQPALDESGRAAARQRLADLPGVRDARLELVCCDAARSILYVGVEEDDASVWVTRPAPTGSVRLPEEIVKVGRDYEQAIMLAVFAGRVKEDGTQGHALSEDPSARQFEDRFITFATEDADVLRQVLHESSDDTHRALAAQVIAYAPDKRVIIPDLVAAVDDPSEAVRNDAIRALGVMAAAHALAADVRAAVPFAPFVRLLGSPIWTDRNKALMVLDGLTETRDPAVLAGIGRDALPQLVEMARWKSQGHSLAALILLGRLAGLSENEILMAWKGGERERVIAAAVAASGRAPTTSR